MVVDLNGVCRKPVAACIRSRRVAHPFCIVCAARQNSSVDGATESRRIASVDQLVDHRPNRPT
jgi:hypothetical protein